MIKLIPHEPPMLWIDQVRRAEIGNGECLVIVNSDAHYMDKNGLRPSSCIEFIAQGFGLISGEARKNSGSEKKLTKAFLASFKTTHLAPKEIFESIKHKDELSIRILGARELGPISLVEGEVFCSDQHLCTAHLKVFSQ